MIPRHCSDLSDPSHSPTGNCLQRHWCLYKPCQVRTTHSFTADQIITNTSAWIITDCKRSKCKTSGPTSTSTLSLSNRMTTTAGARTPTSRNLWAPIMVSTTRDPPPCPASRHDWRWTPRPAAPGSRCRPTRNVSPRPEREPANPASPPHSPCSVSPGAPGGTAPPAASRPASGPRSGASWWTRSSWTR